MWILVCFIQGFKWPHKNQPGMQVYSVRFLLTPSTCIDMTLVYNVNSSNLPYHPPQWSFLQNHQSQSYQRQIQIQTVIHATTCLKTKVYRKHCVTTVTVTVHNIFNLFADLIMTAHPTLKLIVATTNIHCLWVCPSASFYSMLLLWICLHTDQKLCDWQFSSHHTNM